MPTNSPPPLLPPLTPDELGDRDHQERALSKQLQACGRGYSFDIERAFQVMRAYTVEIFRVIYPAYREKSGYATGWLPSIINETIHRVMVISEDHVRYEISDLTELGNELERTLINHLRGDPTLVAPSDVDEAFSKQNTSHSLPPLPRPPLPPEVQAQMEAASQEDDQGNWSTLRRRVEAYKAMKALLNSPKEEIPETVVREALAEQYGVKPEDVTWKQIQFEVSGLLQYYPAIHLIPAPAAAQIAPEANPIPDALAIEIRRRVILLEEYKAATGNPSNKRIYEAQNSGLHKPQFIKWRRGELPNTSATTQNFERFLRERKLPIPRKPKP